MNRPQTEAAISGCLPRRARRHLPAIMAAVDAHAAAGREDLDRVAAEGARRQKLVADEFRAVKAENAELGKQARVLVEERAAALAEANRLRQERDEWEKRCEEARAHLDEAGTQAVVQHGQILYLTAERDDYAARLKATDKSWSELAAERDRLREQLTAHPGGMLAGVPSPIPGGCLCAYTWGAGGQLVRNGALSLCPADHVGRLETGTTNGAPAPGGDAEPAPERARKATGARTPRGTGTRKARGGTDAPRDADGGAE